MVQPKISVIVPIWNTEKYLEKCLNSIVNQTLKDIEIICVNNGSTDSSVQIIEKFAKNDPRIKVVTKEHGCLSSARNAGMAVVTAPYMTFVDSDDWIEPENYELAVAEFQKDPDIDIVCWGANIVNIDLDENSQSIKGGRSYHKIKFKGKKELTDEIILNTTVCVWNKLFKTNIIKTNEVNFPINMELEDNAFFYTYIVNCKYAYFIDRYFYNYIQRKNSGFEKILSRQSNVVGAHLKNLEVICEYYKKNNILKDKKDFILNKLIRNLKFDYIYTQEVNQPKVIEQAKKIADMLIQEFPNDILLQCLEQNDTKFLVEIIYDQPFVLFGCKYLNISYKYRNRYILNILGIKFSFKTKKG